MNKLLSVIIPNYNNSKYLNKCISSVMEQTYRPLEVIVVDDCSTDESQIVLKNLCEQYDNLRVIYQEKNAGVSCARNTGINSALGEYITTLDSDDYYINNQKLENEMMLSVTQNCLAYSKIVRVNGNGERSKIQFLENDMYLEGDILVDTMLGKNMNTIPRDYVIPKSLYERVGLYAVDMKLYEDLDILIRILGSVEAQCTGEEGTAYRQGTGGLSSQSPIYKIRVRSKLCWKNIKIVDKRQRMRLFTGLLLFRGREEMKYLIKRMLRYEKTFE